MEDQYSLVILLYNDIIHTAMNKTPEIFKILRIRIILPQYLCSNNAG